MRSRSVGQTPLASRVSRVRLRQFREDLAFSDPNDLLSYLIRARPRWLAPVPETGPRHHQHLTDTDDDERVIGLIIRGIRQPESAPVVEERCIWLEVGEDLR